MKNKKDIVSIMFITTMLVSNIMANKLFSVNLGFMELVLPAGVLLYPLCFMLGDMMTELWGYGHAKKIIIAGFAANLLMSVGIWAAIILPPAYVEQHEAFAAALGLTFRIVVASIIAYVAGSLLNSYVLDRMRRKFGAKCLWVRAIGSSLAGQVVDTFLFIGIAFFGVIPNNILIAMMISQYVFKIIIEVVFGTPLLYLGVNYIRKHDKTTESDTTENE